MMRKSVIQSIVVATVATVATLVPMQVAAKCVCCDGPVAAASSALGAAVTSAVSAASTAIITNDNFLFRDLTGKPVSQVLREMQGTATMDAATSRKATEQALDAHKNSVIAYNQREQQLEMAREAEKRFPDVTDSECSAHALAKTGKDAQVSIASVKASGSSAGLARSEKYTNPVQPVTEYKTAKTADPRYGTSGEITRPGCTPVYDPAVTAFDNQIKIPVGWNCPNLKAAPNTIPADRSASAIAALNNMLEPKPIPVLPVSQRKTAAGQVYEQQRDIYRNQLALYRDLGMDSLAQFQATRTLDANAESFFSSHNIELPADKKLSEMDYLNKHVQARWDNPVYLSEIRQANEKTLLMAIQETQNLQNTVLFRLMKVMEGQNLAYVTTSALEHDVMMRPELQQLRMKSSTP